MFEPQSYAGSWEEYVEIEREKQKEETTQYLNRLLGKDNVGIALGEILAFTYLEMPNQCKAVIDALRLSEKEILCYDGDFNEKMFDKILAKESTEYNP